MTNETVPTTEVGVQEQRRVTIVVTEPPFRLRGRHLPVIGESVDLFAGDASLESNHIVLPEAIGGTALFRGMHVTGRVDAQPQTGEDVVLQDLAVVTKDTTTHKYSWSGGGWD